MKVTYKDAATGEIQVAHATGSNGIQLPPGATIIKVDPSTANNSFPEWQPPPRNTLEATPPPDLDAVISTLSFQPATVPGRLLRAEAGGNSRNNARTDLVRYYDVPNLGLLLLRESDNVSAIVERVATEAPNAHVAGYDAFMRTASEPGPGRSVCVSIAWSTPRISYLIRLWSTHLERNDLEARTLTLANDLTNVQLR